MSLNIKDEEAHRLARELAELTGESMTTAVREALTERLTALKKARDREETIERWLSIARDCAAHLDKARWVDHGEFLYGEDGLPR
jgi:antitoxin VapB